MRKRFTHFCVGVCCLLFITQCADHIDRPNVLLLTLDTLRADALGCYGNTSVQTPHLDQLAQGGVLFEDAMCQIPATLTSHTAIMTGRNPKTTGVRFRAGHVPQWEETLAERFQAYGYTTAAFISSYVLAPEYGLNQGFDRYELGSMVHQNQKVKDERRADETIEQAISFLNEKRNHPFFAWVHLYDPHSSYDAPAPYKTMYDSDYKGSVTGSADEVIRLHAQKGKKLSDRDRVHLRALYHGEVTFMDHQVGKLFQYLKEEGKWENTIVVALADHGENLGDEGRFFHGDDLYQPSVKIPFVLSYAKRLPQAKRISKLVQTIDLFPTLMELTEIPMISGIEGRSLVPLIHESESDTFALKPGYLETEADPVVEGIKLYGLRTESHKFLYYARQKRSPVPLGVFAEIPLKGPTLVMARIKGDPSIRLMAHIRYRTKELYQSRDFRALSQLNTTVIYAETVGIDPLQQEAMTQKTFLDTPDKWTLQMTPDLYRIALKYGKTQGWPVDWMVLEGVGVDASLPAMKSRGSFILDQIELYTPALKFPPSYRFRDPFWVIENFEPPSRGLADSKEGAPHTMTTDWVYEDLFGGKRQQKVILQFMDQPALMKIDQLFDLSKDKDEKFNLFVSKEPSKEALEIASHCRSLLDQWIETKGADFQIQEMNPAQLEALEALGYTR